MKQTIRVLMVSLTMTVGVLPALTATAPARVAVTAKHKPKHHKHHSCIPQGNRGDRDSDNTGGPSDGDGCF